MGVAVAGEFVAFGHDAAHDRRVTLGDPTQGEERGVRFVFGEQVEDQIGVAFDAGCVAFPRITVAYVGESLDLEIVFDVEGEGVDRVPVHCAIERHVWRQGFNLLRIFTPARTGPIRRMLRRPAALKCTLNAEP